MFDSISHTLMQSSPLMLFVGVILLSYLLEDAAIAFSAYAALEQALSLPLALAAIFIGIASGDLALYGLGRYAHRYRKLRAWLLTNKRFRQLRYLLVSHPILNIFFIRFVPGLRTIGYCLSGFFRIPVAQFSLAVCLATALWTALVFVCVYQLGSISWIQERHLSGWALLVALIGLFALNRWVGKRMKEKFVCSH